LEKRAIFQGGLHSHQHGQAATEFIIAAAFILVPLFLIVPLLGKYIDIKHAAIQHARFTAWEYTVWEGNNETVMAGIDLNQSAGKKNYQKTTAQGVDYFFTDPTSPTYGTSKIHKELNPLWRDHTGNTLLSFQEVTGTIGEHKTPVPLGVIGAIFEDLFQFLGDLLTLFGKLLHFMKVDAEFDAIKTKGYFKSDVDVKVRSLDQILPTFSLSEDNPSTSGNALSFKAKAAVLTNNWNSGSRKNATSESKGLVFTSLLGAFSTPIDKVIGTINDDLGKIPLLEVKIPALPEFGYVEDDLIPYEHLEGNKKKLKSKKGLYSYE
jgi:hypothetical protein